MPDPLWLRQDITKTEHRLLWFLVDVGGLGKVLGYGWVNKCSDAMGLHRITINRCVKRLVSKGLLRSVGKGQVEFNMAGFESPLPDNYVKLKEPEHGHDDVAA